MNSNFNFATDQVTTVAEIHENLLRNVLKVSYGIEKADLKRLTGYEDRNYLLTNIEWSGEEKGPNELIAKISNPIEANSPSHLEIQCSLCDIVSEQGIPCPQAIRRKDGRQSANEVFIQNEELSYSAPLRLFPVLPGQILENSPFTAELVRHLGSTLARLHKVFDKSHITTVHMPFISAENWWCLIREAEVLYLKKTLDAKKKDLLKIVFEEYRDKVSERKDLLDVGLIHSDFNETNILINSKLEVSGVLDFGDIHIAPRALDIGALILYLHLSDTLNQGIKTLAENVLDGYRSDREFNDSDEVLLICMRSRMAASLTYGLRTKRLAGGCENKEDYVLKTQSNGWKTLEILMSISSLF